MTLGGSLDAAAIASVVVLCPLKSEGAPGFFVPVLGTMNISAEQ